MNLTKLQKIRDAIASNPTHFNMAEFFSISIKDTKPPSSPHEYLTTCGTAACIAGFAIAIFDPKGSLLYAEQKAQKILEIPFNKDAEYLFMGHWSLNDLPDISAEEALWYLDGVLKTGDIRWNEKVGTYWPVKEDKD